VREVTRTPGSHTRSVRRKSGGEAKQIREVSACCKAKLTDLGLHSHGAIWTSRIYSVFHFYVGDGLQPVARPA